MNANNNVRPWGKFEILMEESDFKIKKITVNSGKRLSYQFHNKRSESWTIVKGTGIVTVNDTENKVRYGDSIKIPVKCKHRIFNNSKHDLVFIEVQTGEYFGEDDIIRIEDDYNRI
tara:strand:- start:251 stop:598 length:348 start_codon:yes stop_codon:yes gene_type:complete